MKEQSSLETIISLAKRRGFVYQGSDIYGGLAGTWDYGPLGVALKKNIENLWWQMVVEDKENMYGIDAAILMNQNVWKASGHVSGFSDPLVECKKCGLRDRADHLIMREHREHTGETTMVLPLEPARQKEILDERKIKCPHGGTHDFMEPRQFNMMFQTHVGASQDESAISYLRPETAQGIFTNFKNVLDTFSPKLPFGIAQIGKAFRNEIAPRDFLFRAREFEQMEVEYFVREAEWEEAFEAWRQFMWTWIDAVGLPRENVHELDVLKEDLAHYSKKTIDFEFDYPFGRKELYGLAYRTNHDLTSHAASSGVDLGYFDQESGERFIPHVIEPSLGVDRTVLAVLVSAYTEDELGGDKRVYLRLKPAIAPVRVAVFPLLRNKPELVEKARALYTLVKNKVPRTLWDDNGNIGKRYRRQDEIGTPQCLTVDFQTLEDGTVTVRDRDSGGQKRVLPDVYLEQFT